ncbi:S-layer homology domain-containing protein [Arthrobacter sp. NPDC058127]|uniref:S-layer homology domain-containing protein n=1 Tax=Arthrobacter sp. NPDC058127 TaxID=3346351 RepID=UPI0036EA2144
MAAASLIAGTVTTPDGPVFSGVGVQAYSEDGLSLAAATRTKPDGSYVLGGLVQGRYKLLISPSTTEWANQWHGKFATARSSPALFVGDGQTLSGINDVLSAKATISGNVTLPSADSHSDVSLIGPDGGVAGRSDVYGGTFMFGSLLPGTYTLQFNRDGSKQSTLEAQYYKGIPEASGPAGATPITIAAGQVSNINDTLRVGGTITGRINDANGAALATEIRAYTNDSRFVTRTVMSAADGSFTLAGLTTGNYLLSAGEDRTPVVEAAVATTAGQNTDVGVLQYPAGTRLPRFSDAPDGAQFFKEIQWMAVQSISTGWTEANGTRTYRPLQPVNRDAMAAFMYRLAGRPAFTPPATTPFADISTDNPFYKEIAWLAANGISTGWTEANGTKTYRPLQPVNRDAMAAFMYRLAGSPIFTAPPGTPFADIRTDSPFYNEVIWLAANGISTGWTESNGTKTYRPLLPVNRDAMAAFMYRSSIGS